MKKPILVSSLAAIAFALSPTGLQAATPKTWSVTVKAAYIETADNSDAFSALGIDFAEGAISVEDKWIPEFDISYAFTENLVAETVLTLPQKHDVYLEGVGKIGSLEHLPPTFSLVYEFTPEKPFQPYVSAGVNFTWITNKRLKVADVELDLEDFSIGAALGAGFRYELNENWNFDSSVKWIDLESDVSAGGAKLTSAQLDPYLFSLGASYRF